MTQRFPFASKHGPSEHQSRGEMEFLVAHVNAAYNLARWLMRDEIETEDVVEEAYLRAVSQFAGFHGGDGRTWLLKIVRNICYDHLRQTGISGQNTNFDAAAHSAGRQTLNPETPLPPAGRTKVVTQSLAGLPAEYREVLVLREMEQLSYRDIAKIAGISLSAALSRLTRARQQLRQTLLDCTEPMRIDLNDSGNGSAVPA